MVHLDLIFARGRLSYRMKRVRPEVRGMGPSICARPATLWTPKRPCHDIEWELLVITGPDTGGRYALGLLTLMTQCRIAHPSGGATPPSVYMTMCWDMATSEH